MTSRQDVVEVVGDAARQTAHGLELASLEQLGLQELDLAGVLHERDGAANLADLVPNRGEVGSDPDDLAVLRLAGQLLDRHRFAGQDSWHQRASGFLGREDRQPLALGLVGGEAEEQLGRAAPEQDAALAVDDDDRQGRGVQDCPQGFGRLAQRGLQGQALLHRGRLLADQVRHRGDDQGHDGDAAEADGREVDLAFDALERQDRRRDQRGRHQGGQPARRDALLLVLTRARRGGDGRMQGGRGPESALGEVGRLGQRNPEPGRPRRRDPVGEQERHHAAREEAHGRRSRLGIEDQARHDTDEGRVGDQIDDRDRTAERADAGRGEQWIGEGHPDHERQADRQDPAVEQHAESGARVPAKDQPREAERDYRVPDQVEEVGDAGERRGTRCVVDRVADQIAQGEEQLPCGEQQPGTPGLGVVQVDAHRHGHDRAGREDQADRGLPGGGDGRGDDEQRRGGREIGCPQPVPDRPGHVRAV